jgi:hypothetical protein
VNADCAGVEDWPGSYLRLAFRAACIVETEPLLIPDAIVVEQWTCNLASRKEQMDGRVLLMEPTPVIHLSPDAAAFELVQVACVLHCTVLYLIHVSSAYV